MLVLSRRPGSKILCELDGKQVVVTVLSVQCGKVSIGVEAAPEVRILREELIKHV